MTTRCAKILWYGSFLCSLIALVLVWCACATGNSEAFTHCILAALPFTFIGMVGIFYQIFYDVRRTHKQRWEEMRQRHFIERVQIDLMKIDYEHHKRDS